MKTLLLSLICAGVVATQAWAQAPAPQPPAPPVAPEASATLTPSPSASNRADKRESALEKKLRNRFHITVGDDDEGDEIGFHGRGGDPDLDKVMPVAIVSIIFLCIFGAPVLIVGVVMLINYMKARSLHRTVREMVAKGQPVPPELLAGPTAIVKPRSERRRRRTKRTKGASGFTVLTILHPPGRPL